MPIVGDLKDDSIYPTLVFKEDFRPFHKITDKDLMVVDGDGFHPVVKHLFIGRRTKLYVQKGEYVTLDNVG